MRTAKHSRRRSADATFSLPTTTMNAGKGDTPRPVNLEIYGANYERIYENTPDRPENLQIPSKTCQASGDALHQCDVRAEARDVEAD